MVDFHTQCRQRGCLCYPVEVRRPAASFRDIYHKAAPEVFKTPRVQVHDCRAQVVQDTKDPHLWETWLLAHGVRKTVEGVHAIYEREKVKEGEREQPSKLLYKIGKRGNGKDGFNFPRAVAANTDGDIAVADTSNNRVKVYTQVGLLRFVFGTKGTGTDQFDCPTGVAFNRNGDVLVADRGNSRVSTCRRDGKIKFVFDTVDPPCAIASDATFMIVIMSVRRTIEVYRKRGKLLHRFSIDNDCDGCSGRGPCGQIAVNDKDEVIVLDAPNRIVKYFTYEGALLYQFRPTSGADGLVLEPVGMCIDPLGQVIISDRLNHIVNLYSERGVLLRRLLGPVDKAGCMQSCVISPQGHLVATEATLTGQHSLKIFRYGQCDCHRVKGD